jgi:XTP/dITP diphosphohydrolase
MPRELPLPKTGMTTRQEQMEAFGRLLDIMDDLRAKCPWDRKQTFDSLRILTIEETYELADAILDADLPGIEEEIGDLMLHMVFYAKLGSEVQVFDIGSALNRICEKLIVRHPHIYGDTVVTSEEDVKRNWEQIKLQEKGKKSVLQGVPQSLPAMVKAYRIQEKARQVGFDWDNPQDCYLKVEEELQELQQAINSQQQNAIEDEFGDVLFALINYARFIQVDPEAALERTNRKFKKRFEYVEKHAEKPLQDMTLAEMDVLWEQAKSN